MDNKGTMVGNSTKLVDTEIMVKNNENILHKKETMMENNGAVSDKENIDTIITMASNKRKILDDKEKIETEIVCDQNTEHTEIRLRSELDKGYAWLVLIAAFFGNVIYMGILISKSKFMYAHALSLTPTSTPKR